MQTTHDMSIYRHTCDNCGIPTQDKDEILCRKCKPSLQVKADIRKAKDDINDAYWRFCRCARALPPSLAVPDAYEVLRKHDVSIRGYI